MKLCGLCAILELSPLEFWPRHGQVLVYDAGAMRPRATLISVSLLLTVIVPCIRARGSAARTLLYVANSKGDDVTVIDVASMNVAGTIKVGANPHGLVASPDRQTLYVSVEGTDELVSINTATLEVQKRVKVGHSPNQISITRDGRKVFVPLLNASAVDVVDTAEMKVVDRIPTPAMPHNTYVS